MKKFVLLHYGFEKPTPEIMAAWGKWFEATKPACRRHGRLRQRPRNLEGRNEGSSDRHRLHYRLHDCQRGESRRRGEDHPRQPFHFEHSGLRSKVELTRKNRLSALFSWSCLELLWLGNSRSRAELRRRRRKEHASYLQVAAIWPSLIKSLFGENRLSHWHCAPHVPHDRVCMFQLDGHRALRCKSRKLTASARLASTRHHINKTRFPCV